MFNPTLKRRETFLFFLIVVINWLICIDLNIGLDIFKNNLHIHWRVNDIFIMENEESSTHLID